MKPRDTGNELLLLLLLEEEEQEINVTIIRGFGSSRSYARKPPQVGYV